MLPFPQQTEDGLNFSLETVDSTKIPWSSIGKKQTFKTRVTTKSKESPGKAFNNT